MKDIRRSDISCEGEQFYYRGIHKSEPRRYNSRPTYLIDRKFVIPPSAPFFFFCLSPSPGIGDLSDNRALEHENSGS